MEFTERKFYTNVEILTYENICILESRKCSNRTILNSSETFVYNIPNTFKHIISFFKKIFIVYMRTNLCFLFWGEIKQTCEREREKKQNPF